MKTLLRLLRPLSRPLLGNTISKGQWDKKEEFGIKCLVSISSVSNHSMAHWFKHIQSILPVHKIRFFILYFELLIWWDIIHDKNIPLGWTNMLSCRRLRLASYRPWRHYGGGTLDWWRQGILLPFREQLKLQLQVSAVFMSLKTPIPWNNTWN